MRDDQSVSDEPTSGTWVRRTQFKLSAATPIVGQVRTDHASHVRRDDMHYGLELGMVLSGRMQRHYPGFHAEVGPGQVWLAGVWEPHGWEVLKAPCTTVMLLIWPPLLSTLRFAEAPSFNGMAPFVALPGERPQVSPDQVASVRALGGELRDLIDGQRPAAGLWLRLKLLELLLRVSTNWRSPAVPAAAESGGLAHIDRALHIITDTGRHLTTTEAAQICGLSHQAFSQLFERLMGVSFRVFVLRYRLHGAAAQLLSTDDPVKTVARQWGFTDASHLHHWFKQHYRCTPNEYRQRGQHE